MSKKISLAMVFTTLSVVAADLHDDSTQQAPASAFQEGISVEKYTALIKARDHMVSHSAPAGPHVYDSSMPLFVEQLEQWFVHIFSKADLKPDPNPRRTILLWVRGVTCDGVNSSQNLAKRNQALCPLNATTQKLECMVVSLVSIIGEFFIGGTDALKAELGMSTIQAPGSTLSALYNVYFCFVVNYLEYVSQSPSV